MAPDRLVLLAVAMGTAAAAGIDMQTRRVPNALTLSLAAAGASIAALGWGHVGLSASIAGLLVGLGLMLPGHLLGATGAGDVKLFGAVGTLLGPSGIMFAFIYTALSGGVLALLVAARRRRMRRTLAGTAKFVASVGTSKAELEHSTAGNRFAYAPAIAIGAVLAALR